MLDQKTVQTLEFISRANSEGHDRVAARYMIIYIEDLIKHDRFHEIDGILKTVDPDKIGLRPSTALVRSCARVKSKLDKWYDFLQKYYDWIREKFGEQKANKMCIGLK